MDSVTVETLRKAALYQQIVGEFVTLFHLALLGVLGLLYMRWKQRRTLKATARFAKEHNARTNEAPILSPTRQVLCFMQIEEPMCAVSAFDLSGDGWTICGRKLECSRLVLLTEPDCETCRKLLA